MTPLHAACLIGNPQICEVLIESGAEMFRYDFKRFLPIHYAVIKDHVILIRHFFMKHKLNLLDQ